MNIFDIFIKKKKIAAPWEKYYKKKELNYKIPDISIYQEIKKSALKYPNNIAINYLGNKIKFKTLLKKIDICSKGFKNLGIVKGDIVTIMLPNIPEALICLYALNKIGAIANMTHPLSAEEEIKETLLSTRSKYLIIYNARYNKISSFINTIGIKKVIYISPSNSLNIVKKTIYNLNEIGKYQLFPINKLFISWNRFYYSSIFKKDFKEIKYGKNTPAVIIHSGGTSGKPKNVVIQNRAFIYGAYAEAISLNKLGPGDSALAIMPNFHGFGLSVLMHTPLAHGYTTVLVPRFNVQKFDTLLKQTKPTCILGVPTLFEALIKNNNEKKLDLSFAKYIICGGDNLPDNLRDSVNNYLHEHHCKTEIIQGYGLSEALACVTIANDEIYKKGSIGIPMVGNYVKIIDPATRKIKPYGSVGEIVVHSKALMMGYLNDEAETNTALQVHNDGHVWLHTGDLGYMDSDGFIFCEGRIKRMIITSGYNVYPSHIEEILESHPAVLQSTVVGVPHPYKQEVPKAYVVLKEGFHGLFIKQELKNYCKKKLASYMIPSEIVIRKQLPKTKLGKIDFKKLQEDNEKDEI